MPCLQDGKPSRGLGLTEIDTGHAGMGGSRILADVIEHPLAVAVMAARPGGKPSEDALRRDALDDGPADAHPLGCKWGGQPYEGCWRRLLAAGPPSMTSFVLRRSGEGND